MCEETSHSSLYRSSHMAPALLHTLACMHTYVHGMEWNDSVINLHCAQMWDGKNGKH